MPRHYSCSDVVTQMPGGSSMSKTSNRMVQSFPPDYFVQMRSARTARTGKAMHVTGHIHEARTKILPAFVLVSLFPSTEA